MIDSTYIFGLHDPGGEQLLIDADRPGWILFTEEVGHDPNNLEGRDYLPYAEQNLSAIVRLNNGYFPRGTIPTSDRYEAFAQRCANFVANSPGAKTWIIGNEMNFDIERPRLSAQPGRADAISQDDRQTDKPSYGKLTRMGDAGMSVPTPPPLPPISRPPLAPPVPPDPEDPYYHRHLSRFSALREAGELEEKTDHPTFKQSDVEIITPEKYAECFRFCREAILNLPGHASDQVLVGAVAPWNNQTAYLGNERGDWVTYMRDILEILGPEGLDGIALHTYTHGSDPNLIYDDTKMNAPFTDRYYEFRTYQDFMNGIPEVMRHLPVYITETDEEVAWLDQNTGWVRAAYGEIDFWNRQPENQPIRALILYRWSQIDKWYIEGKDGVIEDFRQALTQDYTWETVRPPAADYAEGDLLATRDFVNFRREPGYVNKPPGDVIAVLPEQGRVLVRADDFLEKDGLVWWFVETEEGGVSGWLAQFDTRTVPLLRLIEKADPSGPDDGLGVGSLALTTTAVRLRKSPGYVGKPDDDTITVMPPGTTVAIVGGPTEKDGLTWWEDRGLDDDGALVTGWMAETDPTGLVLLEKSGELERPEIGGGDDSDGMFEMGDQVVTLDYVRFRRTPGYKDKGPDDVLADLTPDMVGTVLRRPRTRDDLTWWMLNMPLQDGATIEGWAAETTPNGVKLLAKVDDGATDGTGTFEAGDGAMTLDYVRFRKTPGYVGKDESDVINDVPPNTAVAIVGGPQSWDELPWWEVDAPVDGRVERGWMAETAPNGTTLLSPSDDGQIPDNAVFEPGELIQAAAAVRVRRSPGIENKPGDDILGDFEPDTTLNVIDGPANKDGLVWYRVGGISLRVAEVIGWVAEVAPDGVRLLRKAPKLPGTDIPDQTAGKTLAIPFRGDYGIAQLWGERPEVYSNFTYDEVPLKGHNGIDFLTPTGTELQAIDSGLVAEAVYDDPSGFGHYVLLHHSWGESLYAHLSDIVVTTGQSIGKGQLIGHSGSTGFSEGPHLHFAIRINPYARTDGWGGYSDPLPYLPRSAVELPDYVLPPEQRRPGLEGATGPWGTEPIPDSFAPGMYPDQPSVRRP